MNSVEFYKNLKPVTEFHSLADPACYHSFPIHWSIVASDVRNSTEQIVQGRFKEVNMVAASVIAAISNHFKQLELPFVFEGDGILLAFPSEFTSEVKKILDVCIKKASVNFGLDLAAGIVSVDELATEGYDISVAKFQLSEHLTQAAFWGNGVNQAEQIIKQQNYVTSGILDEIDLTGLECRWNFFPARNEAASLIIKATDSVPELQSDMYRKVLDKIVSLFGNEINFKPVLQTEMKLTFSPRLLMAEIKMRSEKGFFNRLKYGIKLLFLQLVGAYQMKYNISTKKTNWGDYRSDFINNSDYRKFSGDLKMVITGTTEKMEKLNQYLENLYQQKKITFGMHVSGATISTCYVTEYQNNHVHFIDGADGGYTKASIDFKRRQTELEKKDSKQ